MTEGILGKAGSKNGKSDLARPPAQPPKCPECTSQRVWKDGIRYTRHGDVQRYLCRDCGYRFSKNGARDPPQPLRKSSSWSINRASTSTLYRQVCVNEEKMKNLAKVASRTEKRAAGATKPSEAEIKGKIIEYTWWLKKNAYAESTIFQYTKMINLLVRRGANLFDPESVKDVIARQDWNVNRKGNMTWVYAAFAKMCGIAFERPKYKRVDKLPFIPTEGEVDQLIAGCGKKVATYLQLLKETGMRAGEAWQLQWTDVDTENNSVRVTPEKNSNPRMLKVSRKLVAILNNLPKTSDRVFGDSYFKSHYMNFRKQRKKIANKLENPRILHITFKTLRHFKATMEYHKTKDILHVMQMLGHKNIQNTLVYTHLVNFQDDEFNSKVARTLKEACELVEAGFEYVTEMDGVKIFRKRK